MFAIKFNLGMGFLHLLTHQVDWTQIKCHPCWEDFLDPSGWTEGGSFFPKLWNWVTVLPNCHLPFLLMLVTCLTAQALESRNHRFNPIWATYQLCDFRNIAQLLYDCHLTCKMGKWQCYITTIVNVLIIDNDH